MRKILFFEKEAGGCPVEDFLDWLSAKQAKKVTWVMNLVEEMEVVPKQYFKKLTNTQNIWEIRITIDGIVFRVLGFFLGDGCFIATHGFQKKTQKTPKKEISMAERYKKDYLRRL